MLVTEWDYDLEKEVLVVGNHPPPNFFRRPPPPVMYIKQQVEYVKT